MSASRRVSLFRNGRNQAVRIPREFELPGEEAVMRKEGDALIIEPAQRKRNIHDWLKTAKPVLDDMGEIPDFPADTVDF